MSNYQACFVIPCYNHGDTLQAVVDSLQFFQLPIIVVDDGSNIKTKQQLADVAKTAGVSLVTLNENSGKGGAVMAGIHFAKQQGFSHAIQIDSDGQHDLAALPALLHASKTHPQRLISGQPIYDESVPKARLYGRYATHVWVWIETLSLSIKDSMCGFRAYPVEKTAQVLNKYRLGTRMDFDIEILVRMYWEQVQIDFIPTRVIYPEGGISHFDALWDNVKISWLHTRLFFGMLPRIPRLLTHPSKTNQHQDLPSNKVNHWSRSKEQGTVLGIRLLLAVYGLFGRRVFNGLLALVMRYYHQTSKPARAASNVYLEQLQHYAKSQDIKLPTPLSSYQHLLSFGQTMLDKLAAWKGDIQMNNLTLHGDEHVDGLIAQQKGALILGSHLGNIELCRALSRQHKNIKINAIVFTEHAQQFNSVLKAVNPDSELNLIQVSSMGADTAILLQQKLEQGEWVVIVGDRTSTSQEQRVVWADFLGKPAPFPQGPFVFAAALKAPVFLLFGLRNEQQGSVSDPHFDVYFEPFREQLLLPRNTRKAALQQTVQEYAQRLEHHTLNAPLQWYNFFDFWNLSEQHNDHSSK